MRLLPTFFIAAALRAQPPPPIEASFAQAGLETSRAMLGTRVKGVGIESVTVCNGGNAPAIIAAGRVYQAGLSRGLPLISPLAVPAILARSGNRNAWKVALDIGGNLSGAAAITAASRAIPASVPITTGLMIGYQLYTQFRPAIMGHVPDPAAFTANLLKEALSLPAGQCVDRLALSRYSGDRAPVVVSLPQVTP